MPPAFLPAINATLNAISAALLVTGFVMVRRGRVTAHKRCMLTAFGVSCAFLLLYVTDKAIKGGVHTPFNAGGATRLAYYAMLVSHVLLAMTVPPLAIAMIRFGLTGRIDRHKRLARVALPIWLYVSITGVLVFLALYVFNPPRP